MEPEHAGAHTRIAVNRGCHARGVAEMVRNPSAMA